jgi:hypothetical protein
MAPDLRLDEFSSSPSFPLQTHLSSSEVKKQNVKNEIIREKEDNNKAM